MSAEKPDYWCTFCGKKLQHLAPNKCGLCRDCCTNINQCQSGAAQGGGTKHDQGKPMVGLVSWIFLEGLSRVLTFGAQKYAAHNWRRGLELSRTYDALQRHLWAFWSGEDMDADSGLAHLDHAACELMFLRELWETRKELDDRYKREKA